ALTSAYDRSYPGPEAARTPAHCRRRPAPSHRQAAQWTSSSARSCGSRTAASLAYTTTRTPRRSCASKGAHQMSIETNKELVRRYQEAHNANNLDALEAIVAVDLITHNQMPGLPPGLEGGKMVHQMAVAAIPDFRADIDDLIAEGDKVV